MARLSDLMWHAIWHAPIDETITAESAVARVRARRMARWGSIGGGFAVVAGVVGLNVLIPALAADADAHAAPGALGPSPTASQVPLTAYELLDAWWGQCETDPLATYPPGDTDLFSLTADLEPGIVVDPGDPLELTTILTALVDSDVLTDGVDAVILYDGLVVGSWMSHDIVQLSSHVEGETSAVALSVPLNVCGSTTELGAGDYQLVVSQGYSTNIGGDEPQDGGSSELAPRVTAEPIPFTISGDPQTNPLHQIGETVVVYSDAPRMPENLLDTREARQLFEPLMVENTWSMAPGTSRWIVPQYDYPDDSYSYNYYGPYAQLTPCTMSGLIDHVFPSVSADVDLFTQTVSLPASVGLRYGWIVRDDPLIEVTQRNTSEFYIPNSTFLSQVSLYLFRGGILAGYGYAVNVNGYVVPETDSPPLNLADVDPAEYYGLIPPQSSDHGSFVWQDLHACSSTGEASSLSPGTYTVVTANNFYLDMSGEPGTYTQMQLWTSQGTIEIIE
jgi:hypothetical protein